jgi:branched-chain amino acid transport system ATP-binding protein
VDGLEATGVVVRFGEVIALDGVSFEAPARQITGLVGPKGAGKTTAFNVICGLQLADEGAVRLNGTDISHESPARRRQLGLGWSHHRTEIFPSVSVRDNVGLAVESLWAGAGPPADLGAVGAPQDFATECARITDELLENSGLAPMANRLAAELPPDLRRRLDLARVLARRPSMLLLDDATSGLDGPQRAALGRVLADLVSERGTGILMFEEDRSLVFDLCDSIHVIVAGRPLVHGAAPRSQ